jgi:hypothetical protein
MLQRMVLGAVTVAILTVFSASTSLLLADGAQAGKDTILKAPDISPKVFPERVFYRGQVAPVQMRNTGGVHFADDPYLLVGLVDLAGYGSQIIEKFQAYLLNEITVDVNGKPLNPGAYGIGFVQRSTFIVTDLASNTVLEVAGAKDTELKGPVPLQVLAATEAGSYRLYVGRDYVTFKRTK